MGKKTHRKMVVRAFLFFGTCICLVENPEWLEMLLTTEILLGIKIYHLFWGYLIFEMLPVLFSGFKQESYCGKHLNKHYQPTKTYSQEKLKAYWKKSNLGALRALIFWVGLNAIIFALMYLLHIDFRFAYLLFLFYYLADMICVNVWCPFHSIILKNKCCNECRIYNWGHFMYLTPFILVPNFWTMSLLSLSVLILIQWEYYNYKHPERFSPVSNQSLRCDQCQHECRYNPTKRKKRHEKMNISKWNVHFLFAWHEQFVNRLHMSSKKSKKKRKK